MCHGHGRVFSRVSLRWRSFHHCNLHRAFLHTAICNNIGWGREDDGSGSLPRGRSTRRRFRSGSTQGCSCADEKGQTQRGNSLQRVQKRNASGNQGSFARRRASWRSCFINACVTLFGSRRQIIPTDTGGNPVKGNTRKPGVVVRPGTVTDKPTPNPCNT